MDAAAAQSIPHNRPPKLGPEPTLISRRQVDALYSILEAVTRGLEELGVPYILTGGSLLGAVRQHSILFCDDDVDLAIVETDADGRIMYERARQQLPALLGDEYRYSARPWEGGDQVRLKACSNCFLDIFTLRKYASTRELLEVIGVKSNGAPQPDAYVRGILATINAALCNQGECKPPNVPSGELVHAPMWHFATRKAIEMWPKEVYRDGELFPMRSSYRMGPVTRLTGPHTPLRLLRRAFGHDCFDVYYQSRDHGGGDKHELQADTTALEPATKSGGQWNTSVKTVLEDEHYIPMQPLRKANRRHTLHCRNTFREFLQEQGALEERHLMAQGILPKAQRTIYMDGVFDMLHVRHLRAIEQCAKLGSRIIIGVTGDADAERCERRPIIPERERAALVQALELVDETVCPCPPVLTKSFIDEKGIDLVVRGLADPSDADRQRARFQAAVDEGKFREIHCDLGDSATDIISRVTTDTGEERGGSNVNSKWFGSVLAAASERASHLEYDPFPLTLRTAIERHISKARSRRDECLNAVREITGKSSFDATIEAFKPFSFEGSFRFAPEKCRLRDAFLESCGLPVDFDLSGLHMQEPHFKDDMLLHFASNFRVFQEPFDDFVRSVCCPRVASASDAPVDELFYQCFPCVRVVRPGDFSIGPHSDIQYGHHPCSVNVYLPLTRIEGTAALFLESRPGAEDWHPIIGNFGFVKHFAGATCAHWTPENHTSFTRVSLDFRIIPGHCFNALKCGKKAGGAKDVYRGKVGYYSRCKFEPASGWTRDGPLQTPDSRFGYPWTKVAKEKKTHNK